MQGPFSKTANKTPDPHAFIYLPPRVQSLYDHFSVTSTFFFLCCIGLRDSILPRMIMLRNRSLTRLPSGLRRRKESCSSSGRTTSSGASGILMNC